MRYSQSNFKSVTKGMWRGGGFKGGKEMNGKSVINCLTAPNQLKMLYELVYFFLKVSHLSKKTRPKVKGG